MLDLPVIASMATMPGREPQLAAALASLLPQITALYLYVNDAPGPAWQLPCAGTLHVTWAPYAQGDLGDVGKIVCDLELLETYGPCLRVLADDDIVYPDDYAAAMQAALERHPGAVVGVHGKRLPAGPVTSYYRSLQTWHCRFALPGDARVHLLGSGTAAYTTDTLRLDPSMFPVPNMADIWLALRCERLGVPRWAIQRPAGWLRVLPCAETIYDRAMRDGDALQTALVRAVRWERLGET